MEPLTATIIKAKMAWSHEMSAPGNIFMKISKSIFSNFFTLDFFRLCLLEDDFECRSAEYDSDSKVCILSREDRRTQPEAFRNDVFGVDYIENQCAKRK